MFTEIYQDSVKTGPENPEENRSNDWEDVWGVSGTFHVFRDVEVPLPVADESGGQTEVRAEDVNENWSTFYRKRYKIFLVELL